MRNIINMPPQACLFSSLLLFTTPPCHIHKTLNKPWYKTFSKYLLKVWWNSPICVCNKLLLLINLDLLSMGILLLNYWLFSVTFICNRNNRLLIIGKVFNVADQILSHFCRALAFHRSIGSLNTITVVSVIYMEWWRNIF